MEQLDGVKELLSFPKEIALISHRNPDGDAIGSSLGLQRILTKMGHNCKIVLPSEYPYIFGYLDRVDDMIIFDTDHDLAREILTKADVIFCLDFNALDRVDKLGPVIQNSKAKKILIDHHLDPEPFADFYLSDITSSSTCELIYHFVEKLDYKKYLDLEVGNALFTGIITDTGSFRYATNPNVYRIAGELKQLGVDDYTLNDTIFNSLSQKQLELLGHCLKNRMEVISEYSSALIFLTKGDFETFNIERGDTEGIINYMMMMKRVKIAAFFRQQPTIVKLSLRSKGDISVQELARNHFNGGGHKNASGGYVHSSLKDAINKFKEVLPQYIK